MKLILVNGQGGSGKTAIGKELLKEVKRSAFLDADSLVATNPWEFGSATDILAIKNAVSLARNFSETGFQNVIISGLTRNQELLDLFLSQLGGEAEVLFIWLRASKEVRLARKKERNRDGADQQKHFDAVDALYPDVGSIIVKNGKSIFIEASEMSIGEIIKEVMLNL